MTKLVGVALLAPTCLALVSLWVLLNALSRADADVHFMHTASHQRSLARLLGDYARLVHRLDRAEDQARLREVALEFDDTIAALEGGGHAMGVDLPAADLFVDVDVSRVRASWERMRPAVITLSRIGGADPEGLAAYKEIEALVGRLADDSSHLTTTFETRRHEQHDSMLSIILGVAAICGLSLFGGLWLTGRYAAEQRRAEVALLESEGLFRAVFEHAPIGIALLDGGGGITRSNAASQRVLGYTEAELAGTGLGQLTHPHDRFLERQLNEEMRTGRREEYQVEARFLHKDGREVWCRRSAAMVPGIDGDEGLTIGMLEDVTERHRAASNLARFHLGVERSGEAIFMTNLDGEIIYVNPAFESMYGYAVAEALGQTPRIIKSDSMPSAYYSEFWRALLAKEVVEGEMVNRAKDGRLLQVYGSANPILDEQDEIIGFLAIQRDITEQKQAEQALRDSQERLGRVVESLPDGVCLIEADRSLVLTNTRAKEYLALLGGRALGETLDTLGGLQVRSLLVEGPAPVVADATIDDGSRSFTVSASSVSAAAGEQGWVLVIRETTQERAVQERAREQDRLAAVGQLAAGIAHDFNNMLTVIMNTAELLDLQGDLPPAVTEDLRQIVSQTQRAAQLVRQVLDFSRRNVVEQQRVELVAFLKEATRLLDRTLPEHIRLRTDFGIDAGHVVADVAQLQEVITNLALNARDAMPGGGELRVRLSRVRVPDPPPPEACVGAGDWVVLEVADTGTGISGDDLPHIFEPFYTTKGPGEGTGLGLAQVYGIVKQHGGDIEVLSRPGVGTTIRIHLQHDGTTATVAETAPPDLPRGTGERVLLVEDDEPVSRTVGVMVRFLNYKVEAVADGRQALARFRRDPDSIDVILTDLVMPEMGGLELLGEVKKASPGALVLIMSGYSAQLTDTSGAFAQAAGFVRKPVSLAALAKALHEALADDPERG